MSASMAGAIARRSATASSDDAEKISERPLTVPLQLSQRPFMRAFISPPSLSFTAERRGNVIAVPREASQPSFVFSSSAPSCKETSKKAGAYFWFSASFSHISCAARLRRSLQWRALRRTSFKRILP